MRLNFIARNEAFICVSCKKENPPAPKTYRNHCRYCLTSLHVDHNTPGDRFSECGGIMPAISIEGSDPDKLVLTHKCQLCGKIQKNKAALDDDKAALFQLFTNS